MHRRASLSKELRGDFFEDLGVISKHTIITPRRFRAAAGLMICMLITACSSLPPGHDYPKVISSAMVNPEQTGLGAQLDVAARQHEGKSGFYLQSFGADGFLTRMQMINAAERTLDMQYFIFRGDDTGRLVTAAMLRAADRGVRVRLLLDDGEKISGDDQISPLASHRSIEIRTYNPFRYRGSKQFIRAVEFIFNKSRLNYRMHNKVLVVDNSATIIGGRNIGDQYFQINPEKQYADNDVFAVGPIVRDISASFDEYWNDALSIPNQALTPAKSSHGALREHRKLAVDDPAEVKADGIDFVKRVDSGEPFIGLISGRLPLVWAPAQLISDSPDKKSVIDGASDGSLMWEEVVRATLGVQSELLMITPYLIPGDEGMQQFKQLRDRDVRIRILTNSLDSSALPLAHSGYMGYRIPLLEEGVELYEIRTRLGNVRGSGQTAAMASHGNYSLHAKMFVFDRQSILVGSMNYDPRSMYLNAEIGLLIDSPELAEELARRFEAMVQPANAYQVLLRPDTSGSGRHLIWRTLEGEQMVDLQKEPARSEGHALSAGILSLLPLDSDL